MSAKLNLRVGDPVEIRSAAEILSTLDAQGGLDGLLFMPEMLQYCGKRFAVYKRADKTCDTVAKSGLRRMKNTVHLANMRCDGMAHEGCEAACLIFWKEAWLKRAPGDRQVDVPAATLQQSNTGYPIVDGPVRTASDLAGTIYVSGQNTSEPVYRCQATNLRDASSEMVWWDLRQYARDLFSGNVGIKQFIKGFSFTLFNSIQRWRKGRTLPFDFIGSQTTTPTLRLDLREGELVQIRSKEEILATLTKNNKNRGLWFDVEMLPFCGGTYRVQKRVTKIVNERTGKMLNLPGDCLILEGVFCKGDHNLFCPRSIYAYWREIWLRRVNSPAESAALCGPATEACSRSEGAQGSQANRERTLA
jgi:hypothetical protein